jgi:hypothetical protein
MEVFASELKNGGSRRKGLIDRQWSRQRWCCCQRELYFKARSAYLLRSVQLDLQFKTTERTVGIRDLVFSSPVFFVCPEDDNHTPKQFSISLLKITTAVFARRLRWPARNMDIIETNNFHTKNLRTMQTPWQSLCQSLDSRDIV